MTTDARLVTSAPGKLFVTGEYAVLEGAPAILTAMPQRAKVSITPAACGTVTLVAGSVRVLPLQEALGNTPILDSVLATLGAQQTAEFSDGHLAGKLSLLLDTGAFHRHGRKLGLGSSAALTVALVKALGGAPQPEALIRLASEAHGLLQGGLGSGADIALSARGQDIIFRQHQAPTSVTLPPDLAMLYIWTGIAASSQAYLEQFADWRQTNPAAFRASIGELCASAGLAADRAGQGDPAGLLAAIEDYDAKLERLSRRSRLDFYNQTHLRLRKRVHSAGCIYKLSGAGGGDFGIALSTDKEPLDELARLLTREGIFCFPSESGLINEEQ